MVAFSDCYFCGAVADDLEQYPVIPPEMDPPDDRQRRVVVCPTCRRKVDRIIEPVVAHATASDAGGAADAGSPPAEGAGADAPVFETEPSGAEPETPDAGGESSDAGTTDGDAGGEPPDGERGGSPDAGDRTEDGGDGDGEPVELPEEANQILRLLGNREFPVDRGEIVAVATNAYGVTPGEAEAVLDALVDRDHLREADGTLYEQG